MVSSAEWLDCSDWLLDISDEMISVERRHTNFSSHVENLGQPTKLYRHYIIPSLGTLDTPLRNPGVPRNPFWETKT